MNVKERILTAMMWGEPEEVPLTVYDGMLPRGTTERLLREGGVGLIVRLPGHRVTHHQVEVLSHEYQENGRGLVRRTIRTPVGEVWRPFKPILPTVLQTGSGSTSSKGRKTTG